MRSHASLIGVLVLGLGFSACARTRTESTDTAAVGKAELTSASTDASTTAQIPQGSAMIPRPAPEQEATIEKIYRDEGQQVLRLRQQLMGKRYELNALMMSQHPDEKRTQALIGDVSNLDGQLLQAEATMQQRLSQAGCPMCGAMDMGGGMGMMGSPSGMGWGRMGPGTMGPGMMGPNQLTPEQRSKAEQIYRDEGQRISALRQQVMSKQNELSALLTSQSPDEKRIGSITKDISSLNGQILEAEVATRRRLSQSGIPSWGFGMGMPGGHHGMGMGQGMMGGRQWNNDCGW